MKLPENVKMGELVVQGVTLAVPQPYSAGPITLTEGEASQLNQVLAENLRNNFAGKVDKAYEDAAKANSKEVKDITADMLDVTALQTAFDAYVGEYEFGVRRGGLPRITDPVEREAVNMASEIVRGAIKTKGFKLADVPAEKIRELALGLLEKNPAIREEAKRRVESTKGIALDELNLGTPEAPAQPAAA